jgi:hypothetical protein
MFLCTALVREWYSGTTNRRWMFGGRCVSDTVGVAEGRAPLLTLY